ncbi:MAG: hypothetical protein IPP13_16660 [Kouleothrix sp.]|jgi:hypothetical protein|nr:hypothetical protein [Kouleothrix sp.]
MASATTSRPLPALTSAHQRQLQQLIAVLEAHGTPERDLALLTQLAADLPRFRAGLPAAARAALEDLDQNETAIAAAYHDLREALREYSAGDQSPGLPAVYLLDTTQLDACAAQAHRVAQLAAEVALRARQRIDLLGQYAGRRDSAAE